LISLVNRFAGTQTAPVLLVVDVAQHRGPRVKAHPLPAVQLLESVPDEMVALLVELRGLLSADVAGHWVISSARATAHGHSHQAQIFQELDETCPAEALVASV
jgi:hypothetical protein